MWMVPLSASTRLRGHVVVRTFFSSFLTFEAFAVSRVFISLEVGTKRKRPHAASSSKDACPVRKSRKKAPSKKMVHAGRVFLLRNRDTGQNLWVPLPQKVCARGAAGPAERRDEIEPAMQRHLGRNCYIGADSGPAIQSVCADMGLPASAAVHSAEIFTPVVKFRKSSLTAGQIRTMRKFANSKRGSKRVKGTGKKGKLFVEVSCKNQHASAIGSAGLGASF